MPFQICLKTFKEINKIQQTPGLRGEVLLTDVASEVIISVNRYIKQEAISLSPKTIQSLLSNISSLLNNSQSSRRKLEQDAKLWKEGHDVNCPPTHHHAKREISSTQGCGTC